MIKICKRFWVIRDRVSSRSGKLCENDHWKNIDSHISETCSVQSSVMQNRYAPPKDFHNSAW